MESLNLLRVCSRAEAEGEAEAEGRGRGTASKGDARAAQRTENKHISLVVIYRFINLDKENLRKARTRLRLAARPPGRTKAD